MAETGKAPQAEPEQAPKDLIGFLDFYLVQKAPFQIPDGGREWIVKYGPWIAVVFLVLSLPGILFMLGIGTVLMPFAIVGYAAVGLAAVLFVAQMGLLVAALPGLFARKMHGWRMLFYSQLVGVVGSLASGAIVGAVIGGLIGLYIVFQIRTLYAE